MGGCQRRSPSTEYSSSCWTGNAQVASPVCVQVSYRRLLDARLFCVISSDGNDRASQSSFGRSSCRTTTTQMHRCFCNTETCQPPLSHSKSPTMHPTNVVYELHISSQAYLVTLSFGVWTRFGYGGSVAAYRHYAVRRVSGCKTWRRMAKACI